MKIKNTITAQMKEDDKKLLLKLLQVGHPIRSIIYGMGKQHEYIKKLENELISEGKITAEDIEASRKKYAQYNTTISPLSREKVMQKRNLLKQAEKDKQYLEEKQKVYNEICRGRSEADINKKLKNINAKKYIQKMLREGTITMDDLGKIHLERIPKESLTKTELQKVEAQKKQNNEKDIDE